MPTATLTLAAETLEDVTESVAAAVRRLHLSTLPDDSTPFAQSQRRRAAALEVVLEFLVSELTDQLEAAR